MAGFKGLVLSGGKGTRLRPLTHTRAKQLVPVANRPVLFYGLEALADAGIHDVGIIVAPETGDEIREAVGDGSQLGIEVTFIEQAEPLGLAHAVLTAANFLGDSPFVMYLGDNLLRDGIRPLVDEFREEQPDAMILLTAVPDPEHYGVATLDEGGSVTRLEEKPAEPASDLALVGVYMFTAAILDAARSIAPSGRGELEITDAIQHLIDSDLRVLSHLVTGWWKDTGQVQDLLDANRLIMDDLEDLIEGEVVESDVEGRLVLGPGARIERSRVRGPAIIAAGARIVDSEIGPYTAIDERVEISNASIQNSIVLADSSVRDVDGSIEASLIGCDVKVRQTPDESRTFRIVAGDHAEITVPGS